jgi:hypothetical protein
MLFRFVSFSLFLLILIIASYAYLVAVETIPGLTKRIRACVPLSLEHKFAAGKIDPKLQVVEFPLSPSASNSSTALSWFSLTDQKLFIRHHYISIWDQIEKYYLNFIRGESSVLRCMIMGQPGIGKTVSSNYYLLRAIQAGYPVLLETQSQRFWFPAGEDDAQVENLGSLYLCRYYQMRGVILLHDHQRGKQPPQLTGGAFVVAPMSPDIDNHHDFSKQSCLELWMPLPTKDELWAMNSASSWPKSRERFDELCGKFGQRLRIVLGDNAAAQRAESAQASGILDFDLHYFLSRGGLVDSIARTKLRLAQPWSVVQVDTTDENYSRATSLTFVTPDVEDRVLKRAITKDYEKLESTLIMSLDNIETSLQVPKLYEHWVVQTLVRGHVTDMSLKSTDMVEAHSISDPPAEASDNMNEDCISLPTPLEIDSSTPLSLKKLLKENVAKPSTILAYPDVVNHPWVDAAIVLKRGTWNL